MNLTEDSHDIAHNLDDLSIATLHKAIKVNNLESVKELLQNGADLHAKDKDGKKAIDYATDAQMITYLNGNS